MTIDVRRIAAALRVLADAVENTPAPGDGVAVPEGTPPNSAAGATAAPQKRGRGRPAKGEDAPPAAPAPAPAATEADPFGETPAAPAAPTATLDEVRAKLTALRAATSTEKALAVLKKASGADNLPGLTPDKYGTVVAAVNVELRIAAESAKPATEADPFAAPGGPGPQPAPASTITLEQVKAAATAATKHTAVDTVQKVVMKHGGKSKNPDTGIEGPSLKTLPESAYAAVLAELQALPKTK